MENKPSLRSVLLSQTEVNICGPDHPSRCTIVKNMINLLENVEVLFMRYIALNLSLEQLDEPLCSAKLRMLTDYVK